MARSVWYAVLRAYPWESIIVAGEPLRNPVPDPGQPEMLIPAFSTEGAALAWCEGGDTVMAFSVTTKEDPDA